MFLLLILFIINHKSWGKYSNNYAIIRIFADRFNKICEIVYCFIPKTNTKMKKKRLRRIQFVAIPSNKTLLMLRASFVNRQ